MIGKISERLKLKHIDVYGEQYEEFLQALEGNSFINKVGIYESEIEDGLFIEAEVVISIPTRGVYNNLDIRAKEEVIIFLKSDYPLSAPSVIILRDDFPFSSVPHLNMGVSKSKVEELNLCLYRGDIDEWFYEHGAVEFCYLINQWFSDLVNGRLIKNDGFECIRINNGIGVMIADYEALGKKIEDDSREKGHYVLSISSENLYLKVDNENYKADEKHGPCLLVFDKRENSEYFSGNLEKVSDLKQFNCYNGLNHAIQKYRNTYYDPKDKDSARNNMIYVLFAVKRPQQVIGTFGRFEFIAFLMEFNFELNPYVDNCSIKNLTAIQSLNCKMTERLSGTQFEKDNIVIWGCGALGSKVSLELAKMGYLSQKLYDEDVFLPHNLVRHGIINKYPIGVNKALALKVQIETMYDEAKICPVNKNSFTCEDIFDDGIVIDCTASERNLNWSCMNNLIQTRYARCEIFMEGKLGATFVEGEKRNPDAYDMRVYLWYKAMEEKVISQWLNQNTETNMEFHIGFGCGSDTLVLDDATINNHASVVPHCINKYAHRENGTIVINHFDKDALENNCVKIFEVEMYESWAVDNKWTIHCPCRIAQQLKQIACEQEENMGIWLGHINERMRRITIADTYIPKDNERSRTMVTGGRDGVNERIKNIVKNTGGMIGYIGEWHTHPNGCAIPSAIDLAAFTKVSKSSRPFLMSIITHKATGNWVLL